MDGASAAIAGANCCQGCARPSPRDGLPACLRGGCMRGTRRNPAMRDHGQMPARSETRTAAAIRGAANRPGLERGDEGRGAREVDGGEGVGVLGEVVQDASLDRAAALGFGV